MYAKWKRAVVLGIACAAGWATSDAVAADPAVEQRSSAETVIFVRSTPSAAEVRLDGKPLGQTDGLFKANPGAHKLTIELPGFQAYEQSVTVRTGKVTRVEVVLSPVVGPNVAKSAAPPATATTAKPTPPPDFDVLLNAGQRAYRDWTESYFAAMLDSSPWQNLPPAHHLGSEKWCLNALDSNDQATRIKGITGLIGLKTKTATAALLKIAAERREKDNRDRWMAVRALGLIGDKTAIAPLVDLTYHYNQNTRFWAQISLVRLTHQNFGRNVDAWKKWWQTQGGQPPIDGNIVWTKNAQYSDRRWQDERDRQFIESQKKGASTARKTAIR